MKAASNAPAGLPSDAPIPEPTLWEEISEYIRTKYFFAYAGTYNNFSIGESSALSIAIIIIGISLGIIAALIIGYCVNKTSGGIVRTLVRNGALSEDKAKTLDELGIVNSASVRRALSGRSFLRKYVHYVGEPLYYKDAYFKNIAKPGEESEANRELGAKAEGGVNGGSQGGAELDESGAAGVAVTDATATATDLAKDTNTAASEEDTSAAATGKTEEDGVRDGEKSAKRGTFGGYNPYVREVIDFNTARFYIPDELHYTAEVRYDPKGKGNSLTVMILCVIATLALAIVCLRVFPSLLQLADNLITLVSK